ncbi:MAG: hypothetical protein GY945_01750, partial [Rhodobacteraceae bacterium]|nr:hypothetical protein [Paracoccaceae bacterium]
VSAGVGKASKSIHIEPKVGGAVYEVMYDGKRTEWGQVTRFEAGRALAMTWHPGSNADAPTHVEILFENLPGGCARVTLTHSGWEVWGARADEMRGGYDSGWDFVFAQRFGRALPGS